MNLDTTSASANVNNLSTGSCVVEPTAANNRVCRTIFVHEPLPDVTAEVINRPDLLLRDMADSGVPVTNQTMGGAGVIVQVSNIGEAPTQSAFGVTLMSDSLNIERIIVPSALMPASSTILSFTSWSPISGDQQLLVDVDPLISPGCNTPYGCIREYNDHVTGDNNNISTREQPDIDVAGISATKK